VGTAPAYNNRMKRRSITRIEWPGEVAAARVVQETLCSQVVREDRLGPVNTVAGVDVGFEDRGKTTRAAVVLLSFPGLETVAQAISRSPTRFPYVPGYLSFRELPAVMEALDRLAELPDLILCDGQGLAHPRRFGLACHLGVLPSRGWSAAMMKCHPTRASGYPCWMTGKRSVRSCAPAPVSGQCMYRSAIV
jgi:hypothetical protein